MQNNPIATYLIVLAAGDIGYRAINDRVGVWAEHAVLDKAHNEFIDTEKYIKTVRNKLYD